jgi:hypothetical protein
MWGAQYFLSWSNLSFNLSRQIFPTDQSDKQRNFWNLEEQKNFFEDSPKEKKYEELILKYKKHLINVHTEV